MLNEKQFIVKLEKDESNHYILNYYDKNLFSFMGKRIIRKKLFKGINLWELCYKLYDKYNIKEWNIITNNIQYNISQPDFILQQELSKYEK